MLRSTGGPGPGDIVTCENGHEQYRVMRHQQRFCVVRASDFEVIEPYGLKPVGNEALPNRGRCLCGAKWARGPGSIHMHFKDHGWWPDEAQT